MQHSQHVMEVSYKGDVKIYLNSKLWYRELFTCLQNMFMYGGIGIIEKKNENSLFSMREMSYLFFKLQLNYWIVFYAFFCSVHMWGASVRS